jgi:hypothetical protein
MAKNFTNKIKNIVFAYAKQKKNLHWIYEDSDFIEAEKKINL